MKKIEKYYWVGKIDIYFKVKKYWNIVINLSVLYHIRQSYKNYCFYNWQMVVIRYNASMYLLKTF